MFEGDDEHDVLGTGEMWGMMLGMSEGWWDDGGDGWRVVGRW